MCQIIGSWGSRRWNVQVWLMHLTSFFVSNVDWSSVPKAIAVGPDEFRPDAKTLVKLLMHLQILSLYLISWLQVINKPSVVELYRKPHDAQLGHYLIATWAERWDLSSGRTSQRRCPRCLPPRALKLIYLSTVCLLFHPFVHLFNTIQQMKIWKTPRSAMSGRRLF